MSQHFYQRYVPTVPAKDATARQVSPSQNSIPSSNHHASSSHFRPLAESKMEDERPPKRQRHRDDTLPHREKKKRAKLTSHSDDLEDVNGFAKHRDLQAKYEKAQERSSKQKDVEATEKADQRVDEASIEKHGLEPLPQPVDVEPRIDQPSILDVLPGLFVETVKAHKSDSASMEDLKLGKRIRKNLHQRGITEAFAIQKTVIPMLMQDKLHRAGDVCVSASTGSGKTLSYVLPMVEALRGRPARRLRGLVVVPTRELVNQVRETLDVCTAGTSVKVGVAVGNRKLPEERQQLLERQMQYDPEGYTAARRRQTDPILQDLMDWDADSEDEYEAPRNTVFGLASSIDVLVCTPGRLVEHIRYTRGFHLHDVEWLVVDEADKLLGQSFQEWVGTVIPELQWQPILEPQEQAFRAFYGFPQQRHVHKVILSATMTHDIDELQSLDLRDPRLVVLEDDVPKTEQNNKDMAYQLPSSLQEVVVKVGRDDEKPLIFLRLVEDILGKAKRETSQTSAVSDRMDVDRSENASTTSSSSDSGSSTSSEDSRSVASTSSSGSDSESADSDSTSGRDSTAESDVEDIEPKSPKGRPGDQNKASKVHGVLVFTNTNESAQRLSRLLSLIKPEWQSQIATLSKSTASSSSRRLLSAFRAGRLSILIASDRASRGLDIPDLQTVINYDMPTKVGNYVHRVGRTARAGRAGAAYTLVSHHEGHWFWKEMGKSNMIKRADRVTRREDLGKDMPLSLTAVYEASLKQLGKEARGRG